MIANPKGGCGKSTLATNLASWFVRQDEAVFLADLDRQQSSAQWLARRPSSLPPIHIWLAQDGVLPALPPACSVAIMDTPAGLHGKELKQLLNEVDRVVVPVSPSPFDMFASQHFFEELAGIKAVRKERVNIAIVGMRVDTRTQATRSLLSFFNQFDLPLVTCLRSTQRYLQTIEAGISIFDAPGDSFAADIRQWLPLLDWLRRPKRR